MDLEQYLARIGHRGAISIDKSTLDGLMHAHINAVTFENLNQQMGVPVTMDIADIFAKVVGQRRGGWCFELNSLFGWALNEIGFNVEFLAGQVGRVEAAPEFVANHMFLKVDLEQPLLVDVGYGCGLAQSIPLQENASVQPPYDVSLTLMEDGYWRYGEHVREESGTFDFKLQPVEPGYFDPACHRLQTDPDSPFLRTLTAQRRSGAEHLILRGLVLKRVGREATQTTTLTSPQQLADCLQSSFDLDVPQIVEIWPQLRMRHQQVFGKYPDG